jgi:hypothetical protein
MGLEDILGNLFGGGTPKQGPQGEQPALTQPGQEMMQAPNPEDDGQLVKIIMSLLGG